MLGEKLGEDVAASSWTTCTASLPGSTVPSSLLLSRNMSWRVRYCIFCRFEEDLGSEVVFCIDEWSIALGHRWVFLSVTFMTTHLFQFLPVRRSMTSFSFASQVLHGSTSTSSRERGPVAMTPPASLGSDCLYMSRNMMQMDWPLSLRIKKCSASAFTRSGRVNDAVVISCRTTSKFELRYWPSVLRDLAFLLEPAAGAI